jgi:hypothetical protein
LRHDGPDDNGKRKRERGESKLLKTE